MKKTQTKTDLDRDINYCVMKYLPGNRPIYQEIISKVIQATQITSTLFHSRSRNKNVIIARQIVVNRIHGQHTLSEIGAILGGFDHATVLHNYKQSLVRAKFDKEFQKYNNQIPESWNTNS